MGELSAHREFYLEILTYSQVVSCGLHRVIGEIVRHAEPWLIAVEEA